MLEQLDRSRLIGILFFFSIYWTFVLSSEFIRRTWMSVPGSEALIMYFLAFISSLACLAFLISILPRTVALFLILLLGLASSAANVFCYEYGATVSAESLAFVSALNGAELLSGMSGIAVFWVTMSYLPILLTGFATPEVWSLETRLYVFSIGLIATMIASGLCVMVISDLAWEIDNWDTLWELYTPINLIKVAFS